MNSNKLGSVYKSIDKALSKLISQNAKDYLKHHKDKAWYAIALKGYENITRAMLETFKDYSKKYAKAMEETKKVSKDEDGDEVVDLEDLIEIIKDITEELSEDLEIVFTDKIKDAIIFVAAREVAEDMGIKYSFNSYNKLTRDYLRDKKINWARQVAQTTEDRVKELLLKGFEEGLSSYDIAELIYNDHIFGYTRAEKVAKTEVIAACNYADYSIYQLDESIYAKKWSATGDDRTRLDHDLADGQVRKLNEPFDVGGEKLMYPLDGSLGAGAGNIVNCRCTMFHLTKEEYEKEKGVVV